MQSQDSKKELANKLGISRSSLYYKSKMKVRDGVIKKAILSALSEHPSYGHRRLAIHLGRNKKCILRVMKKFDIKPYRRRVRRPRKKGDLNKDAQKLLPGRMVTRNPFTVNLKKTWGIQVDLKLSVSLWKPSIYSFITTITVASTPLLRCHQLYMPDHI